MLEDVVLTVFFEYIWCTLRMLLSVFLVSRLMMKFCTIRSDIAVFPSAVYEVCTSTGNLRFRVQVLKGSIVNGYGTRLLEPTTTWY